MAKIPVDWSLRDLDNGFTIQPQFPIGVDRGVNIPFGGQLAQVARFGFQDPITHWVQGKVKTYTFETMLFAASPADAEKMEQRLAQFEQVSTKDDTLGRSPICIFTYGKRYTERVLVQDANQQVVSLHRDQTPREVNISLTLVKYVPFTQQQIDPSRPAKESFYLVATQAEQSYEAIAKRFYGDPLLGDRLRKRHPEHPLAPAVGATVKVPARAVVLQEVVEPEAHMFSLTDQKAVANFEAILEARSQRKLVVTS